MSRTMSGLGINGDALLGGGTATAPQTFTGFNKFDELTEFETTRPQLVGTASPTTPSSTDFITKADGEALFGGGGGGDVFLAGANAFTDTNSFNNNLPTSTKEHVVGDLTNFMILNKISADKLYAGNAQISECFVGVGIDTNTLTFSRVDGENPKDIILPTPDLTDVVYKSTDQTISGIKTFGAFPKMELTDATPPAVPIPTDDEQLITKKYVDTTAVLKTTAQEINGEKTFVVFPKIKLTETTPPTIPIPADDAELITKKYVDTTAVLKTTDQSIGGIKTFDVFPEIKKDDQGVTPDPTENNQFATRQYVLANAGGGSGDAVLDGGDSRTPQAFTGFNKFSNTTEFLKIKAKSTTANVNVRMDMESANSNQIVMSSSYNDSSVGGVTNSITQVGGIANYIGQATTPLGNQIRQAGSNSLINTEGSITADGDITTDANISADGTIKSLELRGTNDSNGELLQFINGTGNYPRFVIKGANDTALAVQLGRHGGNGDGYLRCANAGSSANGVFIRGDGGSFFSGGQLMVAPSGTSHGSAKFLVSGGPVVINAYCYAIVFVQSSDDRIKENEKLIVNATETLLKLTPQIYDKYDDMDLSGNPRVESGLIAQEVYYNAPELRHLIDAGITTDASGNDITPTPDEMDLSGVDIGSDPDYGSHGWGKNHSASLDYSGLIAYLIKSNQELHERISILEAKVNNM